jgi:hypothetical protein
VVGSVDPSVLGNYFSYIFSPSLHFYAEHEKSWFLHGILGLCVSFPARSLVVHKLQNPCVISASLNSTVQDKFSPILCRKFSVKYIFSHSSPSTGNFINFQNAYRWINNSELWNVSSTYLIFLSLWSYTDLIIWIIWVMGNDSHYFPTLMICWGSGRKCATITVFLVKIIFLLYMHLKYILKEMWKGNLTWMIHEKCLLLRTYLEISYSQYEYNIHVIKLFLCTQKQHATKQLQLIQSWCIFLCKNTIY